MLRIKNFNIPLPKMMHKESMRDLVATYLQLPPSNISEVVIVRKGIDARRYKHSPIQFVYILDVQLTINEKRFLQKWRKDKNIEIASPAQIVTLEQHQLSKRPLIVGFGPAGMFAGYYLAKFGYRPIIIERGQCVEERAQSINKFWKNRQLNPDSNIQFGEGGAGTFSDGKLTTRVNDDKIAEILAVLVKMGAPEDIQYLQKPHIGTDILCKVVQNMRKQIIEWGGEIRFNTKLTNLEIHHNCIVEAELNNLEKLAVDTVFLGIGHSARDTYEMLYANNIAMEAKPFAIGVRIEHPQDMIDISQYGEDAGNPLLPVADYSLKYRTKSRSVYSFCMCPGGQVVGAASEHNRVVVNGMSNYHRNSGVANSALLVNVSPDDFGHGVLDGIAFQRKYEELAFQVGGGDYSAPVQTVGEFLEDIIDERPLLTKPSYRPGIKRANLKECLPNFTVEALREALPYFGQKIPGFDNPQAVMTGVEMRSSAPCRILRDRESYVSQNVQGLYPIGEGAGYAGGIMSAALDGLNAVIKYTNSLD